VSIRSQPTSTLWPARTWQPDDRIKRWRPRPKRARWSRPTPSSAERETTSSSEDEPLHGQDLQVRANVHLADGALHAVGSWDPCREVVDNAIDEGALRLIGRAQPAEFAAQMSYLGAADFLRGRGRMHGGCPPCDAGRNARDVGTVQDRIGGTVLPHESLTACAARAHTAPMVFRFSTRVWPHPPSRPGPLSRTLVTTAVSITALVAYLAVPEERVWERALATYAAELPAQVSTRSPEARLESTMGYNYSLPVWIASVIRPGDVFLLPPIDYLEAHMGLYTATWCEPKYFYYMAGRIPTVTTTSRDVETATCTVLFDTGEDRLRFVRLQSAEDLSRVLAVFTEQ